MMKTLNNINGLVDFTQDCGNLKCQTNVLDLHLNQQEKSDCLKLNAQPK